MWGKLFGDASDQAGTSIAVDATGAVVTGRVSGSITFGGMVPGTLTSAGGLDIVVAKFASSNGTPLWAKLFGDETDQEGNSIAVDAWGDVVVTGFFDGLTDFGYPSKPLASAGLGDIFVAKLDPTGATLWAWRFGDPADQAGLGIATDSAANVLLTGYIFGTVDFGVPPPLPSTLTSMGGGDVFVAKLSP
jgi:hypothetical protein